MAEAPPLTPAVQIGTMKQIVDAAFRAIQAERTKIGKGKP